MLLGILPGAVILFSVMGLWFHFWDNWMNMPSFLCWEMLPGRFQTSAGASHSLHLIRYKNMHCLLFLKQITESRQIFFQLLLFFIVMHSSVQVKYYLSGSDSWTLHAVTSRWKRRGIILPISILLNFLVESRLCLCYLPYRLECYVLALYGIL